MLLQKISHSWLCAYEVRDCSAHRRPLQFRLYLTMEFSHFYNKPFQRFLLRWCYSWWWLHPIVWQSFQVLTSQLQKYLKKCKQIFWRQQDVLKAKQRLYTACITFWKLLEMCIISLRKIHLGTVRLCRTTDIICFSCLFSCKEITGCTWKGTTASWNWFSTSLPQFLSQRML